MRQRGVDKQLKISDNLALSSLRGVFARINELGSNKFAKVVWKKIRRGYT